MYQTDLVLTLQIILTSLVLASILLIGAIMMYVIGRSSSQCYSESIPTSSSMISGKFILSLILQL